MDGVRASEGWLHLEVVGRPAEPAPRTAEAVADYLSQQGALHVARGQVWDVEAQDAWRVTALIQAKRLPAWQRTLFRLGALL